MWNADIFFKLPTILINDPFSIEDTEDLHNKLKVYIRTENRMSLPLFSRSNKRYMDTQLADFLHGRCLRFQNFAHSILKIDKRVHFPFCLECCSGPDSPSHKIFECTEIPDSSLRTKNIKDLQQLSTNFHLQILFGDPHPDEVPWEELMEKALLDDDETLSNNTCRDFKILVHDICKYSVFRDGWLTRVD